MSGTVTLTVPAHHPAFAGHFPGEPILPGVLLLDEVVSAVAAGGGAGVRWRIGNAKFVSPVRPGETLTLEHQDVPGGGVRFRISRDGQPVAHGVLHAIAVAAPQPHAEPTG